MNFTSRGHLAMETQKHVTLAGGNISIFCYSLSLRAISIQVFLKNNKRSNKWKNTKV